MKRAVWGTGQFAGRFVATHNIADIDFFIDQDIKKCGRLYIGKKVIHPSQITDWEDLYIYVPFNYYKEISQKLIALGLTEKTNFIKYGKFGHMSLKEAEEDYQRASLELLCCKKDLYNKYLLWSVTWLESNGFKDILLQLQKHDPNMELAIVSEAIWIDIAQQRRAEKGRISSITATKIFGGVYIEESKTVDSNPRSVGVRTFQETVDQIKAMYPENANAVCMAEKLYGYIEEVIDEVKPQGIFAECSFVVAHKLLTNICQKRTIPIIYTHVGILPGTISFDIGGEMGESLPARYPKEFCRLAVSNQELQDAKGVWDYLERSKLNRKIQPKNPCVAYIQSKRKPGRPILFFAGQNDPVSGMIPYTETTQKYHSPIFKSSLEAAIYLADLCEKNDWNFVFKPHPSYIQENMGELLPANTIYVETGDINDLVDASDVVITILSQTNYVALIRHRPVVMLGYNQTRGKGCTYEAFEKDKIEDTLREAIENGFTKEQQDAFQLHIAQVLKYYLYDDMSERELRYGRPAPRSISEFYDLERLLKGHVEGNKASLSKSEGEQNKMYQDISEQQGDIREIRGGGYYLEPLLKSLSSSGNSPNILKALEAGRNVGAYCITLSGKGADNKSRTMGDPNFYVPLDTYGLVESTHAVLLHAALDNFLEKHMGGKH